MASAPWLRASPRVSKIVHTVMTCLSSMLLVYVGFVILLLSSVSVGAVRPTSEKVQKTTRRSRGRDDNVQQFVDVIVYRSRGLPRRRSLHGQSEYKRKEDSDTEGIWDTETFPSPKPLEHTPLRTGADFEPDLTFETCDCKTLLAPIC